MEHDTTPRKTVPNQSTQHQHARKSLPDKSAARHTEETHDSPFDAVGCGLIAFLLLVLPGGVGLFLMIFGHSEGDGIKDILLLGATGVVGTWIAMIATVCGVGSSSETGSDRIVQDLPARTKAIMDAHPDMSSMEAAQHIVPPPGDPRSARVSTVRMPDGRVVVVACDPRGGPSSRQPAPTNPQQLTRGDQRHG